MTKGNKFNFFLYQVTAITSCYGFKHTPWCVFALWLNTEANYFLQIIIIILSSKLETKYDYAAWNASYNDLGRNNCVCWGEVAFC